MLRASLPSPVMLLSANVLKLIVEFDSPMNSAPPSLDVADLSMRLSVNVLELMVEFDRRTNTAPPSLDDPVMLLSANVLE